MAGNIVKWWKHKILGGYKQFSVQECTTDSEELMYHQVRAPSSCSAPPDLLLVSDPENNIPLKSPVVNIITATAAAAATSSSSHKQQQSTPHQHHQNTKEFYNKNAQNMKLSSGKNGARSINFQAAAAISSNAQQQHESHQPQFRHHGKEEQRIHLEEFTCDVSVEGGKSSQPLQFSFTFYDLDGHHGKITKDDIVGIVYTIYESIGKSVVVPHCGSKTINVRLTVSPEGKAKASASKLKKVHPGGNSTPLETANCKPPTAAASATRRQHRYRPRKLIKSDDEDDDSTSEKDIQLTAMAASASASASAAANKSKSHATKYNSRAKSEQPQPLAAIAAAVGRNCCQATENNRNVGNRNHAEAATSGCQHDSNLYENLRPAKFCAPKEPKKCDARLADECRECAATTFAGGQSKASDVYLKQTSTRVKMLRKARKQKYQDHCMESRQRSLSLGSGTCWQSRHAKHSPHFDSSKQPPALYSQLQQPPQPTEDFIDGVQLRKPRRVGRPSSLAPHRSSGECWKSAVQRSDLVSILRQSMEKNRLSFQLHGKPQANVSPIRHSHQRQRSNTVSKIPTLIANHSSSITSYNNSNSNCNRPSNNESNTHDINTSCQRQQHPQQQQQQPQQQQQQQQQPQLHQNHHHLQPHIPIYHQQLAINPAVLAAQSGFVHSKANLCGYDSFLHATICGGGTSHSPPPPAPPPPLHCGTHTQQPIAAVQPIMNAINAAHQPQQQQRPSPKIYAHPTATHQQIKTSKILRSGSFSQQQHAEPAAAAAPLLQHSSPQFHGYQRLSSASATKHNLAALNSQNPSVARTQVEHLEKWLHEREKCAASAPKSQKSKKDVKNYDNLLFAKLTEKLQDSSLNAADAVEAEQRRLEVEQRRKQRAFARAQKANAANDASHCSGPASKNSAANKQQQQVQMIVSPVTSEQSNYAALVPINGDPMECENLLGSQTSDEDNSTAAAAATKDPSTAATNEESLQLQITGDLLHFNDDADNAAEGEVEKAQPQVLEGNSEHGRSGSSNSNSGAALVATSSGNAANSASVSSSLVHRYVHEHIHHHYHHFEDKTD